MQFTARSLPSTKKNLQIGKRGIKLDDIKQRIDTIRQEAVASTDTEIKLAKGVL